MLHVHCAEERGEDVDAAPVAVHEEGAVTRHPQPRAHRPHEAQHTKGIGLEAQACRIDPCNQMNRDPYVSDEQRGDRPTHDQMKREENRAMKLDEERGEPSNELN